MKVTNCATLQLQCFYICAAQKNARSDAQEATSHHSSMQAHEQQRIAFHNFVPFTSQQATKEGGTLDSAVYQRVSGRSASA
jgi:hypothetical protein